MPGPPRKEPESLAGYLEVLTKAVFQSGISWRVVEAKADGMREAFVDYDPRKVAAMGQADVERLMNDIRVIRNRRKIEATIDNAHEMLEVEREFGSFKRYLKSLDGYEMTAADLIARFRFLGETGAYFFLYSVGAPAPQHEDWMAQHPTRSARRGGRGRHRAVR